MYGKVGLSFNPQRRAWVGTDRKDKVFYYVFSRGSTKNCWYRLPDCLQNFLKGFTGQDRDFYGNVFAMHNAHRLRTPTIYTTLHQVPLCLAGCRGIRQYGSPKSRNPHLTSGSGVGI
eukprot:NODE_1194_length_1530_cov_2.317353_g991_i0.p3 GENE.NODE_1194_length_1530_cov_2.317353_g991_i0~~NODE_1194_length_1530_cov_2.317353_g991_i0.p3  ORF type:complete len:117 (-),score=5.60 NODE_1194_length_1530_cov_2.317353_g991_i0:643-993(-)